MIHMPTYWGITIAAGVFNAAVWGSIALLVFPVTWSMIVGGLTFAVTFWILSLMQSLHDDEETSQPRLVQVRESTRHDRVHVRIH